MNIYKEHLNVPLHLCEFTIQNNFVGELRLYLFLKKECSGQIQLPPSKRKEIAMALSCGERTVRNHLHKLRNRNWIGFNEKSGYYFIRGFDKVSSIEGLTGRKGCWLEINMKDIWSDKRKFTAFLAAALIGHLVQVSKWKETSKEYKNDAARSDHYKGRSNHRRSARSSSYFYPVSADAIFQIYGIPTSTASDYKRLASEHKFLKVKKSYTDILVPLEQLNLYKKDVGYEIAKRIIVFKSKNKAVLQEPDLVYPLIDYSNRNRPKVGV